MTDQRPAQYVDRTSGRLAAALSGLRRSRKMRGQTEEEARRRGAANDELDASRAGAPDVVER